MQSDARCPSLVTSLIGHVWVCRQAPGFALSRLVRAWQEDQDEDDFSLIPQPSPLLERMAVARLLALKVTSHPRLLYEHVIVAKLA